MSYTTYCQTHSDLLKTIIFPKGNLMNVKKLPEPRYNIGAFDAVSDQQTPSSEQARLNRNQSNVNNTKDSANTQGGSSILRKGDNIPNPKSKPQ